MNSIRELFLRAFAPLNVFWKLGYPRWVVCAVAGSASDSERMALAVGLRLAGAWKVSLVDKGRAGWLATASGGPAVWVDLGARSTQLYCAAGDHAVQHEINFGGRCLDRAIRTHMLEVRGLELSLKQAETLKKELATALPPAQRIETTCWGRSHQGLPVGIQVSNHEIHDLIAPMLEEVAAILKEWLVRIPGQLLDSVLSSGLILAGGTALISSLPNFFSARLGIRVGVADQPRDSVAMGCLASGHR